MDVLLNPDLDKYRAYRRRLVARGKHQLVLALPREMVVFLDEIKRKQGLRSRSEVVEQLIEQGRAATGQ